MSMIRGTPPEFAENYTDCNFCERKADAFWAENEKTIAVCKWCALRILPKVVADSIVNSIQPGSERPWVTIQNFKERMDKEFYLACTMALANLLEEQDACK